MMKLIVFAVDQGMCAYVRTPNDYGILIDCGNSSSGDITSPAEWLAEHELPTLKRHDDKAISLIVTHPHETHLQDIGNVIRLLSPAPLCCDRGFNWAALVDNDESIRTYHSWLKDQKEDSASPDFGAKVQCFSLNSKQAERLGGDDDQLLNNRSVVTVISYKSAEDYSWKLVVAGDNRVEAWKALATNPDFCDAIKGADFFITPCHGQEVGFSKGLSKVMGKPLANISSTRKGEQVDPRYSEHAHGVKFPDGSRKHLIVPDDGNITIEMQDDGRYDVWLLNP